MVRTGVTLSYGNLWAGMRKGMRTGTWRKLRFLDKVLYRAAMSYAKHHCITNGMLVKKLLALIEKLKETKMVCEYLEEATRKRLQCFREVKRRVCFPGHQNSKIGSKIRCIYSGWGR